MARKYWTFGKNCSPKLGENRHDRIYLQANL